MHTIALEFLQSAPISATGRVEQWIFAGGVAGRLLVATVLGSIIGIDREYHHKPSGVRTNLLICFGCALFTVLSAALAGDTNPDKGRIASNIVQGIGFLGAGLILHDRNRVSGLTSAATVFVVASIGMACGAGLYMAAILSTVIVLFALESVGLMERNFNLKAYMQMYEVCGRDVTEMKAVVLGAMDKTHHRLASVDEDAVGEVKRISFPVVATNKQHLELQGILRGHAAIGKVLIFRDPEEE